MEIVNSCDTMWRKTYISKGIPYLVAPIRCDKTAQIMEHETPSHRLERWESRTRELVHHWAEINQFADARKPYKENWERLLSEGKNLIDRLELERDSLTEILNNGSPKAIDNDAVLRVRSESERLRHNTAEIHVARDRLNVAYEEYERFMLESLESDRRALERGLQLQKELSDARITMGHVLYGIKLGEIKDGKDAGSHIVRYVIRHPDASSADLCEYLDSKDIPLPTMDWRKLVEDRYGCALWKYSWEGNIQRAISADKKIMHRTREYLWRYSKMAKDLLTIRKIERILKAISAKADPR